MPRKATPEADRLARYRAKRRLERTPEPAGSLPAGEARRFVVHKHAARRLHFDLRLEMDGVLRSWAVPKGPSYDPADKRLAIQVEDHPVEYGDFEGRIPEGNYGAGAVILWDRGRFTPVGDPAEGLAAGKLLFRLDGYKLQGLWTLVKLAKGDREWLLIKEKDGDAVPGGRAVPEGSVLSGRRVEDLQAGGDPEAAVVARLTPTEAPAREVRLEQVEPMLCETADRPFSRPGWLFELKLDGYRILAGKAGAEVRLRTRHGNDAGATFPEIVQSVAALPFSRLLLDGEVVALDEGGRPSFQRLQQRARLRRAADVRRAAVELPVTYFAFDLLALGGRDLRRLPLARRKALLREVVPAAGAVRYLDHVEEAGEPLYREIERMGLEGVIAKRGDAPYRGGRSPAWLKLRAARSEDFVVVGFTTPRGSRVGLGALHLARYVDGTLRYAGRAGSGLSDHDLAGLRSELEGQRRKAPPCTGVPAEARGSIWVEPRRVCEVRFTEWTDDGLLRQPVFVRWRADKRPEECQGSAARAPEEEPAAEARDAGPAEAASPRAVRLSNLSKVYWPEEGYTKGDLIAYYRAVAPWILPYLRERPLVLTRYPDGIAGKSFYQKDAPEFTPDWVRTQAIWSEDAGREIRYIVCDEVETLTYLANLGSIPLHLWASRVGSLEQPDWCVLDLDPKEAAFQDVVTVARQIHDLCQAVELPCFVKTTGKTGLHVLIPLGRQCTWEQSRGLGELLARIVLRTLGDIATLTRPVGRRGPKVYLDYLQNRRGQLIAAPFSVRPLPGAPVSMPLEWREVNARLDPKRFTIRTALDRLEKTPRDPLAPVLSLAPDLAQSLDRLAARLAGTERRGKAGAP
ncbi:MAG: DNA ligase D [Candidatus Methylomirabilales bacterium]